MTNKDKFDFSAAMKELEAITTWFEGEQVDLDEGLKKFERGMELAGQLKAHLNAIENRVQKVKAGPADSDTDAAGVEASSEQLFE